MLGFFKGLFGDQTSHGSARFLRSVSSIPAKVAALEATYGQLSDTELAALTSQFRTRLADGAKLESLIPEAFAAVREAAKRALGLRAFDVQLLGALALHHGRIAEMKTGEGKTLVATFAVYLNALEGKGVHVVTVNDYLASRDAAWMGQVYAKLGMTTAAIVHGLDATARKQAYAADICYATNNELGFDYLRDHMALSPLERVQRPLHYAVVDEVDSILIDEARTPLIISGPADDRTELYQAVDALMPTLRAHEHYEVDEKQKQVHLTEDGIDLAEAFFKKNGLLPEDGNLYDVHNLVLVHHLNQGLRAHTLFRKDVEYIIKDMGEGQGPEVVLIDEFTGRMTPGRRLSEGLHQAIEAKEHVAIKQENQTMASVTYQNYFRLYPKLAGMTGTAATEAEEFEQIYGLPVTAMPTNLPVSRKDEGDVIYRSREGKRAAIIEDIKDCHQRGQPVLVGTVSIERSEELAGYLKQAGIRHQVLNARYHELEAEIIAQAGRKGAVTIATNMAGRGTDIKPGGNLELLLEGVEGEAERAKVKAQWQQEHDEVMAAGGLRVLGTERHESRRIDNQLRGRTGRQGDVGSSVFYLSLQDDLLKRFAPNLDSLMARFNMPEDEAITHSWISKSIETAQRKIESIHFDIRKSVLKFDDILNEQRKVVYSQRQEILSAPDVSGFVADFREQVLDDYLAAAFPPGALPEQWQPELLREGLQRCFNLDLPVQDWLQEENIEADLVTTRCRDAVTKAWEDKLASFPAPVMRNVERMILLQTLDRLWRQHLQSLDWLRKGIGLRGMAQKDPLNEFARESYMLFEDLLAGIRKETTAYLSRVQLIVETPEEQRQIAAAQAAYERGETPEPLVLPGDEEEPLFISSEPLPVTPKAPATRKKPTSRKAPVKMVKKPSPKTKPTGVKKPTAKPVAKPAAKLAAKSAVKKAPATNTSTKAKPKSKKSR